MDQPKAESNARAMDRRRFLRRAAFVAWATPTIMTLTAQSALATTCAGVGCGSQNQAGGCAAGAGRCTCTGSACVAATSGNSCVCT